MDSITCCRCSKGNCRVFLEIVLWFALNANTLTVCLQMICGSVSNAWKGSARCLIYLCEHLGITEVLCARDAHTSPMVIKCCLLFSCKHKSRVGRDIS